MHEDLIAWDEDERKQCREEWELLKAEVICRDLDDDTFLSAAEIRDEAGLAAVRELRNLRRLTDTARTVRA